MSCGNEQFVLPTIEFVGGSSQDLVYHTYFYAGGKPFDLSSCEAFFSVIGYANRGGKALFSKKMSVGTSVLQEGEETVSNVLRVTLDPSDTVDLCGKYIYQITIRDVSGDVDIPKKGILIIEDNIARDLIS